jgi:transcriptional regulator with XRE-family HTH domain
MHALHSHIASHRRGRKPFPTIWKSFGDLLRTKRVEMGLTQPELAQKLGISKFQIGLWERGLRRQLRASRAGLSACWCVPVKRLIGTQQQSNLLGICIPVAASALIPLLQKRRLDLIQKEAGNFQLPAYPGLIVKESYWRWTERNL